MPRLAPSALARLRQSNRKLYDAGRGLSTTTAVAGAAVSRSDTLSKFDEAVMKTYGRYDIVLSHGKGRSVWDVDGREYLDFGAGIAVSSLGHAHPAVVSALTTQAEALIHCSNLYYHEPQGRLARSLVALFAQSAAKASDPLSGGKVFFSNTGAEANEGLFKLARAHGQLARPDMNPSTAKNGIVTTFNSFHGETDHLARPRSRA